MRVITILLTEISQIRQKKKDLRNFGIIFFIAGLVASSITYLKHDFNSLWVYVFAATGLAFLVMGFYFPGSLKIPHKVWMSIAVVLGYFFTRVILILTYVFVITPMGLFLKILRKDLLDLRTDKDENTYWKEYDSVDSKERYTKMF